MNLKRQKTVVAGCLLCMAASSAGAQEFRQTEYGIQAESCGMVVDIRFYSPPDCAGFKVSQRRVVCQG